MGVGWAFPPWWHFRWTAEPLLGDPLRVCAPYRSCWRTAGARHQEQFSWKVCFGSQESTGIFFAALAVQGGWNLAQLCHLPAVGTEAFIPSLSFSSVEWEYYHSQRVLRSLKCGHIRQCGTHLTNIDSGTGLCRLVPSLWPGVSYWTSLCFESDICSREILCCWPHLAVVRIKRVTVWIAFRSTWNIARSIYIFAIISNILMIKGLGLCLVQREHSVKFHHLSLFFTGFCWSSINITSPISS